MKTLLHVGGAFVNVVSYTGLDPVIQIVTPATSTDSGYDNPARGINMHPKRAEVEALIKALQDALVNSETQTDD